MNKFLAIVIFGLLISINVIAGEVKVLDKGSNFIIIKEKRPNKTGFNPKPDPNWAIPLNEAVEEVNNYCSSKGLYGFYILAKLSNTVNDTSVDFRAAINAIWQDGAGLKFRYFCANNSNEAYQLFNSDTSLKTRIKIYPGGLNSFNGWLTKSSHIDKYFVKTTSSVYAKIIEDEKRKKEEKKQRLIAEEKKRIKKEQQRKIAENQRLAREKERKLERIQKFDQNKKQAKSTNYSKSSNSNKELFETIVLIILVPLVTILVLRYLYWPVFRDWIYLPFKENPTAFLSKAGGIIFLLLILGYSLGGGELGCAPRFFQEGPRC